MWMPLFPINRVAKCSHAHARVFTNVTSFLHLINYMCDYVYIIYAFVKFLDEPTVIICLSCHPGILSRAPDSGVLLYSTFHTLVENMVKKNRSRFSIAVLLTTVFLVFLGG